MNTENPAVHDKRGQGLSKFIEGVKISTNYQNVFCLLIIYQLILQIPQRPFVKIFCLGIYKMKSPARLAVWLQIVITDINHVFNVLISCPQPNLIWRTGLWHTVLGKGFTRTTVAICSTVSVRWTSFTRILKVAEVCLNTKADGDVTSKAFCKNSAGKHNSLDAVAIATSCCRSEVDASW